MPEDLQWDVVVIGAGAAGLFCGAIAAARGLSVIVVDHSTKPAEKVRISGGGRCNFTNLGTSPECFISQNPHFAKSALARYTPHDFLTLMDRHGLSWHEKTLGQLFCDQKSTAIIKLLLDELDMAGGTLRLSCDVGSVEKLDLGFDVNLGGEHARCRSLVISTGGLSIPKIGATGFAYDLAARFGLSVVPPEPALVPLTFEPSVRSIFSTLSGVSCPVTASCNDTSFDEAMLFTHRGLSGPAILQISSYWKQGDDLVVDLLPNAPIAERINSWRREHGRKTLSSMLETLLPRRLVESLGDHAELPRDSRIADLSSRQISTLDDHLTRWVLTPDGTEGWQKAEVTRGGISTDELSSKTMESRKVPGLYFIGECVDVTGWLGGYNFQWAWASAWAAAHAIERG